MYGRDWALGGIRVVAGAVEGRAGAKIEDVRPESVRLGHSVCRAAPRSGGLESHWRSDRWRYIRKRGGAMGCSRRVDSSRYDTGLRIADLVAGKQG